MREILFRGKRIDNGEWVEGCLAAYDLIVPNYPESTYNATGAYYGQTPYVGFVEVDPETVGQFTGRKDLNNKKVFEHDILQLYTIWADGTKEKSARVIVQWLENDQCYVLTTIEGCLYDDFGNYGNVDYYEVIGKIHDSPGLLKGG